MHTRFARENFFSLPNYSNKGGEVDHSGKIDEASNEARNCTIKFLSFAQFNWICFFMQPRWKIPVFSENPQPHLMLLRSIIHIWGKRVEKGRERGKRLREKINFTSLKPSRFWNTLSIARNVCFSFYSTSNFNLHLLAFLSLSDLDWEELMESNFYCFPIDSFPRALHTKHERKKTTSRSSLNCITNPSVEKKNFFKQEVKFLAEISIFFDGKVEKKHNCGYTKDIRWFDMLFSSNFR